MKALFKTNSNGVPFLFKPNFHLATTNLTSNHRMTLYTSCRYLHQQQQKRIKKPLDEFAKCWEVLEITPNSDSEEVRRAYLNLSKKYHPDSNSSEANPQKFHEIDLAYKTLQAKFADERDNAHKIEGEYGLYYMEKPREENDETESPDIKHTAPQHRQYLSFDGVGSGTISQRQKQYQTHRALKAVENVQQHRLQKIVQSEGSNSEIALIRDAQRAKKTKTGLGIERLVEDMIQESMARGDFQNLKGSGKPLNYESSNPYIDFTTHKLNQVLIDNGFVPEWILLEKEVRQEIDDLRLKFKYKRHTFAQSLNQSEFSEWEIFLQTLKPEIKKINAKIDKYNLLVPILQKQIVGIQIERESRIALANYSEAIANDIRASKNNTESSTNHNSGSTGESKSENLTLLGFLSAIFK